MKRVSLTKNELNGHDDNDDDNNNNELNLTSVRDTSSGRIVNTNMINLLKQKSDIKDSKQQQTNENKKQRIIDQYEKKKNQIKMKSDIMKYFQKNQDETNRKQHIQKMFQTEVHDYIKAFGVTVIDSNGNGYKVIKLQELKQNLYQVVIDSINSNPNVDYDDDDMSIDS